MLSNYIFVYIRYMYMYINYFLLKISKSNGQAWEMFKNV